MRIQCCEFRKQREDEKSFRWGDDYYDDDERIQTTLREKLHESLNCHFYMRNNKIYFFHVKKIVRHLERESQVSEEKQKGKLFVALCGFCWGWVEVLFYKFKRNIKKIQNL